MRVGDSIEAHLKDGGLAVFEVTSIESDAFVGAKQRVEFAQIAELRVRHVSPAKTAGLAGVVIVGTAFVVVIVAAATGQIAFMPAAP